MAIRDLLLPEFEYEMANTRKALERTPDDKLGWKPHEKSGSLGWLASHLADLPSWVSETLQKESLDLKEGGPTKPSDSRAAILERFDRNVAEARKHLASAKDDQFAANWKLVNGEQTLLEMPRIAVIRSMVMNHLIHHRGQFTVYLRMNNVPVPALYGPSADESPF